MHSIKLLCVLFTLTSTTCSATALTALCSAGGVSCTGGGTCCSKICSGNLCTPAPGDPCTPSGGVCFPAENICCSKVCDVNAVSAHCQQRFISMLEGLPVADLPGKYFFTHEKHKWEWAAYTRDSTCSGMVLLVSPRLGLVPSGSYDIHPRSSFTATAQKAERQVPIAGNLANFRVNGNSTAL
ncbi:hypothetical protein B0H16DRAFT_1469134 [Mycena metata]|uniref:Uncharacterized protein n=1 Tax=Mycena metata TaxID=1033252 RepID=A0AAD7HZ26_9AGAR|nr:hypothetical protein B0H16DRAFT_1469134 [Mycena metata]